MDAAERPLVLACAALVRELRAVLAEDGLADAVEVEFLPARLHNRPERIVPEIEQRLASVAVGRTVVLAYADCGTGGLLDDLVTRAPQRLVRLPGAHCQELFAGAGRFAELHEDEPGTFYLTDFLARHFEPLVWQGLGLDRHPELRDVYFGRYRRVVLLSQSADAEVTTAAEHAAGRLGLPLEHVHTGLEAFAEPVRVALGAGVA